jgi:hypothetical protein
LIIFYIKFKIYKTDKLCCSNPTTVVDDDEADVEEVDEIEEGEGI